MQSEDGVQNEHAVSHRPAGKKGTPRMKTHTHSMGRLLGRLLLLMGLLVGFGLLAGRAAIPGHAATTLTVTNCSNDSQLQADRREWSGSRPRLPACA
jgi:hypothetical protein